MRNFLTTLILVFLQLTLAFGQADICGIRLVPDTRIAAFAHSEQVTIEFDYDVAEPGGARIFARPFTNGSLTSGYSASGSPLYSGTGTSDGNFTINSGNVTVDEIRILVTNADQSVVLREMYVPVEFYFGEAGVNNFQFSHSPSLSSFLLSESFSITFDHNIDFAGGTRIFFRPFTDGELTPSYGASGSPLYTGSGSSTANFTINSGINVHVDSIRVRITNADQSETIEEFFLPVNLYFSTVKITNINATGGSFAMNGESRTIDYDYETTEIDGAKIFPRPWTNTGLTPGYGACGSPNYTGAGSSNCSFTINGNNQHVDHIRFLATNNDQSMDLLTIYYPVDYTFGEVQIHNIVHCPQSPVRMDNGEKVNLSFDIKNNTGGNLRIFTRPFTDGALSTGYGASGSPSYSTGNSTGDDFFTINSGNIKVDQIRFQIMNDDQSVTLGEFFFPADYVFGAVSTPIEQPQLLTELKAYPNPFKGSTQIEFVPIRTEKLTISIYDLTGRKLGVIAEQQVQAGKSEIIELNSSEYSLSSGIYLVVLKGEFSSNSIKLVKSN